MVRRGLKIVTFSKHEIQNSILERSGRLEILQMWFRRSIEWFPVNPMSDCSFYFIRYPVSRLSLARTVQTQQHGSPYRIGTLTIHSFKPLDFPFDLCVTRIYFYPLRILSQPFLFKDNFTVERMRSKSMLHSRRCFSNSNKESFNGSVPIKWWSVSSFILFAVTTSANICWLRYDSIEWNSERCPVPGIFNSTLKGHLIVLTPAGVGDSLRNPAREINSRETVISWLSGLGASEHEHSIQNILSILSDYFLLSSIDSHSVTIEFKYNLAMSASLPIEYSRRMSMYHQCLIDQRFQVPETWMVRA